MKQVSQNYKTGAIRLEDTNPPVFLAASVGWYGWKTPIAVSSCRSGRRFSPITYAYRSLRRVKRQLLRRPVWVDTVSCALW